MFMLPVLYDFLQIQSDVHAVQAQTEYTTLTICSKKNSDNLPATLYIPLTRTMDALYLQAE